MSTGVTRGFHLEPFGYEFNGDLSAGAAQRQRPPTASRLDQRIAARCLPSDKSLSRSERRYNFPSSMTELMRCVFSMSARGLASNRTRSAILPGSTVPRSAVRCNAMASSWSSSPASSSASRAKTPPTRLNSSPLALEP